MAGRFAPTPSGRMHMGNAYAMLAAWLSARARHALILLRVDVFDAQKDQLMPCARGQPRGEHGVRVAHVHAA